MTKELEDKLVADFPELYQQVGWSPQTTCMCWGFEVADEWEPPIRRLSEELTDLNYRTRWSRRWRNLWYWFTLNPYRIEPIQATQVKTKFGGLRFYLNHNPVEANLFVRKAEHACWEISGDKYLY